MKKLLAILACMVLAISSIGIIAPKSAAAEEAPELKPIDMYLIGGQSNAAGYSSAKAEAGQTLPTGSFDGIMYGGQVDRVISTGASKQNWLNFSNFKTSVTAGYGASANHIGPEYGMSKVLSANYSVGNKAFIFKSAAGGTSLNDYAAAEGSGSYAYGNWYPRSLWADGYTPSLEAGASDYTGVQYLLFIENFKKVYNELIANGYSPKVKGMVWMQGEEDMGAGYADKYASVLQTFIKDIRNDLTAITGDFGLAEMPFVAGKIQLHFAQHNNLGAPTINNEISSVAERMTNVATVETADLVMVNSDGSHNGPDKYHFSVTDAETLGERFATELMKMEITNTSSLSVEVTGGSVDYDYDQESGAVTLKNFAQNDGYKLSSVVVKSVNGGESVRIYYAGTDGDYAEDTMDIDLTEFVENYATTYNRLVLSVTFTQQKVKITITNDAEKGAAYTNPTGLIHAVGSEILINVVPKQGYEVDVVTFNGVEVEPQADGRYPITIAADENAVVVTYKEAVKDSSQDSSQSSSQSSSKPASSGGCGGNIGMGVLSLLGVCLATVSYKSRKR